MKTDKTKVKPEKVGHSHLTLVLEDFTIILIALISFLASSEIDFVSCLRKKDLHERLCEAVDVEIRNIPESAHAKELCPTFLG